MNTDFTINSPIVLDCLEATINCEKPLLFSGGLVGVQSYVKENPRLFRTSSDIDTSFANYAPTFSEFKDTIYADLFDNLSNGYKISSPKKKRQVYEAYISDDDNNLVLQVSRRSKLNFEKNKSRIKREYENGVVQTLDKIKYKVLSPEDIILHKILRIIKYRDCYNINYTAAAREDLSNQQKTIKHLKKELQANLTNLDPEITPRKIAEVRALADIYDIQLLDSKVGIDKDYFKYAKADWSNKITDANKDQKLIKTLIKSQ